MTSKETFLKQIEAQEKRWKAQMMDLDAKATAFEAKTRKEFDKCMDDLEEKFNEAKIKAEELKKMNEETWKQIGNNASNAWDALSYKINEMISKMSTKK